MNDYDDMLGIDNDPRPKPVRAHRWKRESRGPLHDLVTRALPDLVDEKSGVCDLHKLAKNLGMTYQGVYKWFKPGRKNQLPPNQVDRIVLLSQKQKTGGSTFKPVSREDFWDFLPG